LELAFAHVGLDWQKHVEIDPKFYRPAEVERLIGNPEKARKHLHWSAQTKFADLVRLMVDADVKLLAERHGRPVRG
jgi:GDPmannose 4,6-dehydratase